MVRQSSRLFLIYSFLLFLLYFLPSSYSIQCYVGDSNETIKVEYNEEKFSCYISDNWSYGFVQNLFQCGLSPRSRFCCSTDLCNNLNETWVDSAYNCKSYSLRQNQTIDGTFEEILQQNRKEVYCDGPCMRSITNYNFYLTCGSRYCPPNEGCRSHKDASEICCCKGNNCLATEKYPLPKFFIDFLESMKVSKSADTAETTTADIRNLDLIDSEVTTTNIYTTTVEELPDYFDPKSNGEYETYDDDGYDGNGGQGASVTWILLFFIFC